MFGTIVIDPRGMQKEERRRYCSLYCGLCSALGERFGSEGRRTLSYDMTFVGALLAALYELPEQTCPGRCPAHPLRRVTCATNEATAYAADMNLYLYYYKQLDDWQDEKSRKALRRAERLAPWLEEIRGRWPRQCEAVDGGLARLSEMEKRDERNPDLPASCFGELMGELLVWREDCRAPTLRRMGMALGRFIYLLDAANDLKGDLRHLRYNPLVAQGSDILPALTLEMSECTDAFEALGLTRDLHLLRNVLYAGVWTRCRLPSPEKGKQSDILYNKEGTEEPHGGPL